MLIGNSSNSQTPTPPPAARPVTSYNLNMIHISLHAEFNMNDVISSVFSFYTPPPFRINDQRLRHAAYSTSLRVTGSFRRSECGVAFYMHIQLLKLFARFVTSFTLYPARSRVGRGNHPFSLAFAFAFFVLLPE